MTLREFTVTNVPYESDRFNTAIVSTTNSTRWRQ